MRLNRQAEHTAGNEEDADPKYKRGIGQRGNIWETQPALIKKTRQGERKT